MNTTCPNCLSPFISPKKDKEYTENTILLEGSDDKLFLFGLMKAKRIKPQNLTLEAKDGYSTILSRLKNIELNPGLTNIKKLLIFADANDEGVKKRFNAICSIAKKTKKFSLPTKPGKLSNPISGKKQLGIYFFPDNENNGILEDLCLQALAYPQKLQLIEEHINQIKQQNLLQTKTSELSKSKFHIYMATSKNPTGNIGGATFSRSNEINFQAKKFDTIVSLLQEL